MNKTRNTHIIIFGVLVALLDSKLQCQWVRSLNKKIIFLWFRLPVCVWNKSYCERDLKFVNVRLFNSNRLETHHSSRTFLVSGHAQHGFNFFSSFLTSPSGMLIFFQLARLYNIKVFHQNGSLHEGRDKVTEQVVPAPSRFGSCRSGPSRSGPK